MNKDPEFLRYEILPSQRLMPVYVVSTCAALQVDAVQIMRRCKMAWVQPRKLVTVAEATALRKQRRKAWLAGRHKRKRKCRP